MLRNAMLTHTYLYGFFVVLRLNKLENTSAQHEQEEDIIT